MAVNRDKYTCRPTRRRPYLHVTIYLERSNTRKRLVQPPETVQLGAVLNPLVMRIEDVVNGYSEDLSQI
jgi:hypothetical protein